MDFVKQYILQSITAAANHLRLTSDKIESVTLLKEFVQKTDPMIKIINDMKKVTELSKLGVRLGELYNYLSNDRLDFMTMSDTFKDHSHKLVRELSYMLDVTSPSTLKTILENLKKPKPDENKVQPSETKEKEIELKEKPVQIEEEPDRKAIEGNIEFKPAESGELHVTIDQKILDEAKLHNNLTNPLRELAVYINDVEEKKSISKDIDHYISLAENNLKYSSENDLPRITEMMKTVTTALKEIKIGNLNYEIGVIEGLRCCLIVSLAHVKKKDVDISNYLKKAEEFGKKLSN